MMQELRIFISSPGDVSSERVRAREVIESLQRRYAQDFLLKPIFWEDLPLQPDMSFQEGIDVVLSERGADIAIFILWSRLGSPLGAAITKADGSLYRSGTERELDVMMQARACSRERGEEVRPSILVYTRQDEVSFEEALRGKSTSEKRALIEQKELVESFINESFMDAETGTSVGAYFPFDRPTTFTQRLRVHLQDLLDRRLGDRGIVVWDTGVRGSPFLGLEAYQAEHAEVFHGREEEVLEARRAMRSQASEGCAFLLLSGASGSGKSSLARAGVMPEIVAGEVDEQVACWKTVMVTPSGLGDSAVYGLVLALSGILPRLRDGAESLKDLADALRRDARMAYDLKIKGALAAEAEKAGGGVRVLLLVDQLEEIFTMSVWTEEVRREFLDVLEVLARSGGVWVMATVRSDFYPQVQSEAALVRMKGAGGLFDVLPAGPDALARLIREPARLAGLYFEERGGVSLADRILKDSSGQADVLPLVSFVLRELYERRTKENGMTFEVYEELGGVEGALARRAEETFCGLPEVQRRTLGGMLSKLVTLGSDVSGERLLRVAAVMEGFQEDERCLVEEFVAARLFTTGGGVGDVKPFVMVAHESLLRVWGRATDWAEKNRDFLRVRARVDTRMREGSPLLGGDPLLATAVAYLKTEGEGYSREQRGWIEEQASQAAASVRRAGRRRSLAIAVVVIFALFAVAGGIFAMKNRELARAKDAEVEKEKVRNGAFYLLHRAGNLREDGRLPEALGLFAEAYEAFPDFSTRSALLQGLLEVSPELETTLRGFGSGVGELVFGEGGELLVASVEGKVWRVSCGGEDIGVSVFPVKGEGFGRVISAEANGKEKGWVVLLESGDSGVIEGDVMGLKAGLKGMEDGCLLGVGSGMRYALVANANPRVVVVSGGETSVDVEMEERVSALAMDEKGSLAVGLEDGSVVMVDSSGVAKRLMDAGGSRVVSMAWGMGEEGRLLVGNSDGDLRLLSLGDEEGVLEMPSLPCRPVAMGWNPVDGSVAVGGSDGILRILRRDSDGWQVAVYRFHREPILSVAWSGDGKRLASGAQDGSVALWSPGGQHGPVERREFLDQVTSLDVSKEGERVAVGTSSGEIIGWGRDEKATMRSSIPGGEVHSLAWSETGEKLAAGSGDDRVFVLEAGGEEARSIYDLGGSRNADEVPVNRLRWSADGSEVMSGSFSTKVMIHGVRGGESRLLGELSDLCLGMDWCGRTGRVAAGSTRGEIFVWDGAGGNARCLDKSKGHGMSVGGLAWHPTDGKLASCGNDGTVRLWDVSGEGKLLVAAMKVDTNLEEVVYSGDGGRLATVGADGYVRVLEGDDLEPYFSIEAHDGYSGFVVWRGDELYSCSKDGSVMILNVSEVGWIERALQVAGVDVTKM